MMKRILSGLLALLMVVSILPVSSFAENDADVAPCATCGQETCICNPVVKCETCGNEECTCEEETAKPCTTCGKEDCTSDHKTWCAACKKDDCGVDHTLKTIQTASIDSDRCIYCEEEQDPETGVVTHERTCNSQYSVDASSHVGKTAVFSMISDPALYTDSKPSEGINYEELQEAQYNYENPPLVKITNWHWEISGPALWYQVEPLSGETLPDGITTGSWIFQKYTNNKETNDSLYFVDTSMLNKTVAFKDATAVLYDDVDGDITEVDITKLTAMVVQDIFYYDNNVSANTWYYVDSTNWPAEYADHHYVIASAVKVVEVTEPEEEKSVTLEQETESEQKVTVVGMVPQGTQLSVRDVTVDPADFGIADADDILAALDIKLLDADGEEYQPYTDETEVVVTLDAEALGLSDGDIVTVRHQHGDEITVYEPYVVIGGKLTFWTDRFSVYVVSQLGSTATNNANRINNGATYTIEVGETVVFYENTNRNGNTQIRGLWAVTDPSHAVEATVLNSGNDEWGNPVFAPWVQIKAIDQGTVTLTHRYRYNAGTNNQPNWTTVTTTIYVNVVAPEPDSGETTKLYIDDNTAESGCLVPAWSNGAPEGVVKYGWTRSDGIAVQATALHDTDGSVNISIDRGGVYNGKDPITYTVTAYGADDTVLATATFRVTYGNEILNPSFENPDISQFTGSPTHINVHNEYPGLYWKTTAPGTGGNLGMDVEIARNGDKNYGPTNSTAKAADGSQFVELNAEQFGTLYQDILTTPGATLSWEFSHNGRSTKGSYNTMYVIVAATKDASQIINYDTIKALQDAISNKNTVPSSGAGYKLTYNDATYYVWRHAADSDFNTWETISGTYDVPANQYLTRLFFASEIQVGSTSGSTMGNLIDDASAGEFMDYRVQYYKDNQLEKTVSGTANAYTTVPLTDLQGYLETYEYPTQVLVNGKNYPGTLEDLKKGLYITDYGSKIGNSTSYNEDIIVQIYFQVPNIVVIKKVNITDWDSLTLAQKQNLLKDGINAKFALKDSTGTVKSTAELTITQVSASGELTAMVSFPKDSYNYNVAYTVEETSATQFAAYQMETTISPVSVRVTDEKPVATVNVINTYHPRGSLKVTKFVEKEFEADEIPANDQVFQFTAIIPQDAGRTTYPFQKYSVGQKLDDSSDDTKIGELGTLTANNGVLTFTLADGQYIVIDELPQGAVTVSETKNTGFADPKFAVTRTAAQTSSATNFTGTITPNGTEVFCVNTFQRTTGTLKITKSVVNLGTGVVPVEDFTFHVEMIPPVAAFTVEVVYTDANQNTVRENQNITVSDCKFDLVLKDGWTATIAGLPACQVTVTEDVYDNFETSWGTNGNTGIVSGNNTLDLVCTNTYPVNTGNLKISKIVAEPEHDRDTLPENDEFTMQVDFTTEEQTVLTGSFTYKIFGKDDDPETATSVSTGTISSGGTLVLKADQYALIYDIPACKFEVTETAATSGLDNYDVSELNEEGSNIRVGETVTSVITNTLKRQKGNIKISKSLAVGSEYDGQEFLFHVKNSDGVTILSVMLGAGEEITIYDLPLGVYTVEEDTSWSWRYDPVGNSSTTVNLNEKADAEANFTNNLTENKWLNATDVETNTFEASSSNNS